MADRTNVNKIHSNRFASQKEAEGFIVSVISARRREGVNSLALLLKGCSAFEVERVAALTRSLKLDSEELISFRKDAFIAVTTAVGKGRIDQAIDLASALELSGNELRAAVSRGLKRLIGEGIGYGFKSADNGWVVQAIEGVDSFGLLGEDLSGLKSIAIRATRHLVSIVSSEYQGRECLTANTIERFVSAYRLAYEDVKSPVLSGIASLVAIGKSDEALDIGRTFILPIDEVETAVLKGMRNVLMRGLDRRIDLYSVRALKRAVDTFCMLPESMRDLRPAALQALASLIEHGYPEEAVGLVEMFELSHEYVRPVVVDALRKSISIGSVDYPLRAAAMFRVSEDIMAMISGAAINELTFSEADIDKVNMISIKAMVHEGRIEDAAKAIVRHGITREDLETLLR